jgi:ferredoxin
MTDLLRWPVLGPFARHRRARLILQLPLLAVAVVVVAHGLFGPQIAPRNLATVLTWVHYRGLLVIALLAIGNVFCTACPMMLVRDAARRAVHPAWRWPRALRRKWPAIVLFAAVLFAYERFDLWSLPRATAWLVLAYFAGALVVDVLFAGASFCKYVCPIGQFNFLSGTLSPTELRVRNADTCRACRTVDCIRGRLAPESPAIPLEHVRGRAGRTVLQRGCELNLFLPAKIGNLDCTLCLDCVHACPHDNIALITRVPGEELVESARRSGIGRLSQRPDLAVLCLLFVFGAVLNAFAMTAPAHLVETWIASTLGTRSETGILAAVFAIGLVVLPIAMLGGAGLAASLTGTLGGESVRTAALRYAFALVPLGLGIWTAHYGFHLLTGIMTIIPVGQSAVIDLTGQRVLGEPLWMLTGMRPGAVYVIQLGCVLIGMLGSLAVAFQLSARTHPGKPLLASIPWTLVIVLLAAAATWVLSQPMEMRAAGLLG